MAYNAELSRTNPGCILFLIDQSGSMNDRLEYGSKADEVASILNRTLQELIAACGREEGVRDYFDVGVIGYHSDDPKNALQGALASKLLHPISQVEAHPVQVEDRIRKMSDGAGGIIELPAKFPVWFLPTAIGGTPMCDALTLAAEVLLDWCDSHPSSFPPVMLHLTDGESTDGDPQDIADKIRQISTNDGQTILMNVHISGVAAHSVAFPDSDADLGGKFAQMLFRMSSPLVGRMNQTAKDLGFDVTPNSRAFMFNAKTEEIVKFFEIGTRPSNLR